jgi:hypothetical protein
VESRAQDDEFQEVKRRKRHISNNTSQTAKKSTKQLPTSAAVKMPPKAVLLIPKSFASLRTTDMDTEATEAENTLPEQNSPRKPGRQTPIVMTSTTNLIRFQIYLKGHTSKESTISGIYHMEPVS